MPIEQNPKLLAVVRVDMAKSKKLIQSDLNKMSKGLNLNLKMGLGDTNKGLKQVSTNTKQVNRDLNDSLFTVANFKKELKTAIVRTIEWNFAMTAVLGTVKKIKEAGQFLVDIDTSLTEIAMVTGQTRDEVSSLGDTYLKLAEDLKVSTKEIANSAVALSRQGLSLEETEKRLVTISKVAKVAGISLEQATTFITVGVNAMKVEAEDFTDVLVKVGAVAATDFQKLATAFQKSASSFNNANISLEKAASLIAVVQEVTQESAESIGTSFKTILARFNKVTEAGEDNAETLNAIGDALRSVGIEQLDANGQLRNTDILLDELAPKWEGLDTNTRAYLATTIAGIRQQNRFLTLMDNYGRSLEILDDAMNSAGETTRQYQKFQESLQAQVNEITVAWEKFYKALLDEGTVSGFLAFIKDAINVLTKLEETVGILNIAIIAITISFIKLKGVVLIDIFTNLGTAIGLAGISAQAFLATLIPLLPFIAVGGAVVLGIVAITAAVDGAIITQKEYNEMLSEYNALLKKGSDLTRAEYEKLKVLEAQVKAQEKANEVTEESIEIENKKYGSGRGKGYDKTLKMIDEKRQAEYEAYLQSIKNNEEREETSRLLGAERERLRKLAEEQEAANDPLKKLAKTQEEYNSALDDFQSFAKDVVSIYDDLNDGEKLSADTLLDLIQKYPEYATQLANINSSKEAGIEITKILFELEKNKSIATLQAKREEILANDALIASELALIILKGGQAGQAEDPRRLMSLLKENDAYNQITESINLLNEMTLENFDTKDPKTTETDVLDNLSKEQQAIKDITDEIDILSSKISLAEGEDRIKYQEQLIQKYKEQQDAVHNYADSLRIIKDVNAFGDDKERLQLVLDRLGMTREEVEKLNKELSPEDQAKIIDIIAAQGSEWWKIQVAIKGVQGAIASYYTELKKERDEAIKELRESIKAMVEEELKSEIDAHKELIRLAKEELDIRLKQIDAEKDLADFSKNRADKEEDIANITNKINSLKSAASQGDKKAQAELLKLEEDRSNKQEELDELINDRSYELRKEGLEKQYDEYEDVQKDEIKLLEEKLENEAYITKKVNDEINEYIGNSTSMLYENLAQSFEDTIISKWKKAIELVNKYNSAVNNVGFADPRSVDYWKGKTSDSKATQAVIDFINSGTGSDELIAKNIDWLIKDGNFYDNGGKFEKGDVALKNDNSTEWILKDSQLMGLQQMAISEMMSMPNLGAINSSGSVSNSTPINIVIEGNVDNDNINKITETIRSTVEKVSKGQLDSWKGRGYKPPTRVR